MDSQSEDAPFLGEAPVRANVKAVPFRVKAAGALAASFVAAGFTNHWAQENRWNDDDKGLADMTLATGETDTNNLLLNKKGKDVHKREIENVNSEFFNTVFHNLNANDLAQARSRTDGFKSKIADKSNYIEAHQEIPLKYKNSIRDAAEAYGISFEALMGIIAVENGGGTDVENPISGAVGVAQFMPDTARQYGLIVNDGVDQRKDPVLSIDAAGRYLRDHKQLFGGDEGLAVWSYHAGAGVVFSALQEYFIDIGVGDIGNYGEAIGNNDALAVDRITRKAKKIIVEQEVNVHKLLMNKSVQREVLSHLHDYSDTYPYQVMAAWELINEYVAR